MDVETMRRAVALSDRIAAVEDSLKRVKNRSSVRLSFYSYDGTGRSLEDLTITGKAAAKLYSARIRELKDELRSLSA